MVRACGFEGIVSSATLLVACAGTLGEAPQVEESGLYDSSGAPVIATLQAKDGRVTISAAGGHVRYALIGGDGVEKSLTPEELQVSEPDLYEIVKHATAVSGGRGSASYLDARVEPESRRNEPASRFAGSSRTP